MTADFPEMHDDDAPAGAERGTPLQRLGVPDDIANVVLFLASDGVELLHRPGVHRRRRGAGLTRSFEELVAEARRHRSTGGTSRGSTDGRPRSGRRGGTPGRWRRGWPSRDRAALDIQTGGGEVLAAVPAYPPVMVATEGWPPNVAGPRRCCIRAACVVVADADEPPLPFADEAFDLVVSRHPVTVWWDEIARVLRPGGTYFSQQVGPAQRVRAGRVVPRPAARRGPPPSPPGSGPGGATRRRAGRRRPAHGAAAHGVLRHRRGRVVPAQGDLDGARASPSPAYEPQLRRLHERIERDGPFVGHDHPDARRVPQAGLSAPTFGGMQNRVCEMLGIEFPILAFTHCRDVVAAVTKAGGLGVLGAAGHTPEELDIDLRWIAERGRRPPVRRRHHRAGQVRRQGGGRAEALRADGHDPAGAPRLRRRHHAPLRRAAAARRTERRRRLGRRRRADDLRPGRPADGRRLRATRSS